MYQNTKVEYPETKSPGLKKLFPNFLVIRHRNVVTLSPSKEQGGHLQCTLATSHPAFTLIL